MYFSLHGFNISITVPGVVTSLSGEEESLEGCGENSMHLSGGDFHQTTSGTGVVAGFPGEEAAGRKRPTLQQRLSRDVSRG